MSVEFTCDGCGKRARGHSDFRGNFKPHDWFERGDEDGVQHACSRECIEQIAAKTGKTRVVLPL